MTIGILGGGLTGCTLGKLFADRGWGFEILEAEHEIGGLLRSTTIEGYTFDSGGPHIIFSKNKDALAFLLSTIDGNYTTKKRNTKILYRGRFVKYPFENGLSGLPLADNLACLFGFFAASAKRKLGAAAEAKNLRDWCLRSFGKGISKRYLLPYNEKIWKFPLDKISTGWVERIPSPPMKDVVKSSLGVETEGYVHQLNFHYPTEGGIESVIHGLTKDFMDRIVTDFPVKSIRKDGDKWVVSDGRREKQYDAIVSTIPLPTLSEVAGFAGEAKQAADSLKVNSVICVCLGGAKLKKDDISWLYLPSRKSMPHRVSFLSYSSEKTAPPGKSAFIADITCQFGDEKWNMDDSSLVQRVVEELVAEGVILSAEHDVSLVTRHRYAYVIDDISRNENIATITKHLSERGIMTCGRFAEFEYLNMDGIVARAFDFVSENETELGRAG